MNRVNPRVKMISVVVLLGLLLAVPTAILAQDDAPACNPAAARLAEVMDIACQELLDLQGEGHGLGEIMKAWYLAEDLQGLGDWRELLEKKQAEDLGWGQMKMASRLAGEDGNAQLLLDLKQSGIGWGQIKKAQALEESGLMAFDEALALFQSGAGWDEIRAQLGLEEGPPPWAGPKDKSKGANGNGPPPWANNDKNENKRDE